MAFTQDNAIVETRYRIADSKQTNNRLLDEAALESVFRGALLRVSTDLTPELVTEFAGAGTSYYQLSTVLPLWVDKLSSIRSVVYPAVAFASANNAPPTPLDQQTGWTIEEAVVASARAQFLYFPGNIPTASELIRVLYTGVHTLSGLDGATATTIQAAYEQAFYDLCASRALLVVANDMARRDQPTVSVDIVNNMSSTTAIRKLSQDYMDSYLRAIGGVTKDGSPPSDGQFLNWDTQMQWGNSWMFHGRWGRR